MGRVRSLAACVVVTCTACTSFAETAQCSAPRLVTMAGTASDPLTTDPTIELWNPDGRAELLTDDPAAAWPAVSPDGETVAVALGEGEWTEATGWPASRVALLAVDSGEVSVVSAEVPGGQVSYLQWSTSGAEIAFTRFWPRGREVAAIDVQTGQERRVLPLVGGQRGFTWSPDGTEMLVPTTVGPPGSTTVELRRYFLGSGHHVVVDTFEDGLGQVSWSPGGRWIALQAFLRGTTELRLHVLDDETGETIPVDLRPGRPGSMTWSGPFLLYRYDLRPESEPALMSWDSRTQRRTPVERPGLERFVASPISAPRCDSAAV